MNATPDPDEYVDPDALTDLVCDRLAPAEAALHGVARDSAAFARVDRAGMFGNVALDAAFEQFTAAMAHRTADLAARITELTDMVREAIVEHSDVAAEAAAELERAAGESPVKPGDDPPDDDLS